MTKSLMVVCGTDIATSTIATGKVKEYLASVGKTDQVKFLQSKIADEVSAIENADYDIIVSTTMVPSAIKDKVINGVPLLTGVGTQKCLMKLKSSCDVYNEKQSVISRTTDCFFIFPVILISQLFNNRCVFGILRD